MFAKHHRAYSALLALTGSCVLWGCVADRPSRNGVFNENQYIRKDFLVQPGDGNTPDRGWFVKSTIVSTTTPNPLANVGGAGLFAGAESSTANYVRFDVTQDKLSVVNLREISNDPATQAQNMRAPETMNSWPIVNVDLKYRINLDGEKTNFYEENQELDWQVRQWVKLNFAKNDMSDLYMFYGGLNPIVQKCTDQTNASVTLVPNSFNVDTENEYWEYTTAVTVPIAYAADDAATCIAAFGGALTARTFFATGRQNVTLNVKTAFVRPDKLVLPTTDANAYVPMPLDEKDPIRRKYGAFEIAPIYRDPNTQLLTSQSLVGRFNPNKDIVYYFSPGMPDVYKQFFVKPGGLVEQTNNNVFGKTAAKGRLKMLNYNDATTYGDAAGPVRALGDPRYSWISWHSDLDNNSALLGIAQFFTDPHTGETLSATVNVFEGAFKDTTQQRLDLFLQTVGQEYLTASGEFDDSKYPPSCKDGDTVPLVPANVAALLNRQSTVYGKMQAYMQKPFSTYGYLGPADFLPTHDADFYNAYFAVLPYNVYADPQANPYVIPEGTQLDTGTAQWGMFQKVAQFNDLAAKIDQGVAPYDVMGPNAITDAVNFSNTWESLAQAVTDFDNTRGYGAKMRAADDISLFSYFDIYTKNGRHCVNGKWESRADYTNNLITSLNMAVAAHEFGHTLGLRHNFMGSVDQRNFPLNSRGNPTLYASSLMDYNQTISEAFFETTPGTQTWGPYDMAALAWIYGNTLNPQSVGPTATPAGQKSASASGQVSATAPWNDPLGFKADGKTEVLYLYCSDEHVRYTPLCRRYDAGVTPSEIMANDLQQREWNYLWTNFRLYHKYFSTENYGMGVVTSFNEMRRFASLWAFDWSGGELTNNLRLVGTKIPAGSTAADYYNQLTNKFNTDASIANQLAATYHRAIIEQASGERPYVTIFDPFYGDVTQQGIQIDKVQATTSFSALWPALSNYDPTQATGLYISTAGGQFGDSTYISVARSVLSDFLGAAFATFQYAQLGPIANFAASTHSAKYGGDLKLQTWVGGWAFNRERDFLDFVRQSAVASHFQSCDENGLNCNTCTTLDTCTWDPRNQASKPTQLTQSDHYNRFQSPDGRTYIWGFIRSRNQWVLADRDRNIATYTLMLNWLTDVINGEDDGFNGASPLEYKVRYIVDAFTTYDGQLLNAP